MAIPYNGQLNQNKITRTLYNMIISQRVFDSSVASTELADMFKVDGTLFGDTKLYHSFDIGSPENWADDEEAADLLKLNRNKSGITQSIKMGVYKIISITVDQYLSKQAFMKDGSFAEYTSFLTGSLRKIKRVYDRSIINSKLGTLSPATDACAVEVVSPRDTTIEGTNRLQAQAIARAFDVLIADLEDNSRYFNSLGYLRSYKKEDFVAIWNVEVSSKITRVDIPTIFHKDLVDGDGGFKKYILPQKWFGDISEEPITPIDAPSSVTGKRILKSGWYKVRNNLNNVSIINDKPDDDSVFFWAGDLLPYNGQVFFDYVRGKQVVVDATVFEGEFYTENANIACVLVHKEALPYMSGFETGTEFWNGRSLTTNHYLIFGHNELEFLEEYPRIKITTRIEEE